jgi:hypothetical protein
MLRRWDVRVYDVRLLMAALDYVLDLMDLDSKFCGRRFGRPLRLYVEALVLKELCKVSLRYAEGLSLKFLVVRIPKSTLFEGALQTTQPHRVRLLDNGLY